MWEPALSSPMSWNSMSCTTVPESQSSLESPECGRSAAEATSQTLKRSSACIQNIFPMDNEKIFIEMLRRILNTNELGTIIRDINLLAREQIEIEDVV